MSFKTCPKCNKNLILDNGELCSTCKKTINQNQGILSNYELKTSKGTKYQKNLDDYEKYLIHRNYEEITTAKSYTRALTYISDLEKLTFTEMYANVNKLTHDYGLNGSKKDLGERSKGTWRCALDRLKDFAEYISMFNDPTPNKNPNVEQIKAKVTSDLILSLLRVYFTNVYSKEYIEQALNDIIISVTPIIINEPVPLPKPEPKPVPVPVLVPKTPTSYSTVLEKKLTKQEATQICRENGIYGDFTFASKNKTVDLYWANPPFDCIKRNWWLILNDNIRSQLHVFYIPAHTISSYQLEQRKDKIKPPCWNIKINYNDSTFEESVSKIKFLPWFIKTISY